MAFFPPSVVTRSGGSSFQCNNLWMPAGLIASYPLKNLNMFFPHLNFYDFRFHGVSSISCIYLNFTLNPSPSPGPSFVSHLRLLPPPEKLHRDKLPFGRPSATASIWFSVSISLPSFPQRSQIKSFEVRKVRAFFSRGQVGFEYSNDPVFLLRSST